MLKSTAKRAAPGLVLTTALDDDDDDGVPEAAAPERVALAAPETLLVVLAMDDDVDATPYSKELVYVVHDEVAGITTGVFPGGA